MTLDKMKLHLEKDLIFNQLKVDQELAKSQTEEFDSTVFIWHESRVSFIKEYLTEIGEE